MPKEKIVRVLFVREQNGQALAAFLDYPGVRTNASDCVVYSHEAGIHAMPLIYVMSCPQIQLPQSYRGIEEEVKRVVLPKLGDALEVIIPDRRRDCLIDSHRIRLKTDPCLEDLISGHVSTTQ